MTNIKLEAMITKIREILSGKGLTERDFDEATKEILDLYNVMQRDILNDMIMQQEEIVSSPIRFNGVHIENIKKIFKNNGTKYQSPF